MKGIVLSFIILIFNCSIMAQETKTNDLPYYEVPEYYESYTAGTVAARMVDGLGMGNCQMFLRNCITAT